MDLTDKKDIKRLLRSFGLRAKRELGQNFLIDKRVLQKIIKVADLKSDDIVLEIGPGLGVLTREFCKIAKKVFAIEKDEMMVEVLKFMTKGLSNLEIIKGDVLSLDILGLIGRESAYKIVSNLPFYISSPTFRKFLELKKKPKDMTLVVQKEVAEKAVARPGDLNILGISVQLYAKAEIIQIIESSSFWPEPKVKAAILKIIPFERPKFKVEPRVFFRIVKAGFGEKRKKLSNSLSGGLVITKSQVLSILRKLEINENTRAEDLSLKDWYLLYLDLKDMI